MRQHLNPCLTQIRVSHGLHEFDLDSGVMREPVESSDALLESINGHRNVRQQKDICALEIESLFSRVVADEDVAGIVPAYETGHRVLVGVLVGATHMHGNVPLAKDRSKACFQLKRHGGKARQHDSSPARWLVP